MESAITGLAAHLIGLYLALHAFFAPEFIPLVTGTYVPIVAMLALLLPAVWLAASPQHLRFLQAGVSKAYILLAIWFLLSVGVMSFQGYIPEILIYVLRFHTVPVILCGLLLTLRNVRHALFGYSFGFIVALVLCWKLGEVESISGRFIVPETSLGNPNDLALNLLFGLAYMSILLINSNTWKRLLFIVCFFATMYLVLRTGSRANFLTAGVLLLTAWLIASARVRMMMLVGCLVAGAALVALVPKETWLRLSTFSSISDELSHDARLRSAVGSTEARKQLQIRAIVLTFQNPIFGVGPRMFIYALNDYMTTQEGYRKGSWQHPHNTYLDISSETGLVGLGLYVTCIFWCLRTNYRSVRAVQRRTDLKPALAQSCCLLFATVVFSFGTLFCSIPYVGQMPFLLGLTAANWLALRDAGAFNSTPLRTQVLPARRQRTVAVQPR